MSFPKQHDIRALCLRQRLAMWTPRSRPVGLYPEESKGRNQYATIGDKKVFSSNLINDARFSFHTYKYARICNSRKSGSAILQLLRRKSAGRHRDRYGRTDPDRPERIYS